MVLGADDVQAAGVDHLLVKRPPFHTAGPAIRVSFAASSSARVGPHDVDRAFRQDLPAEDDVGAAARHFWS